MIAQIPKSITAARFARDYADVPFCELENGEVVYLTAGGWNHSWIVSRITQLLGDWSRKSRKGRVLAGEAGLITQRKPDSVRGIDVVFVSYRRIPRGKEPTGFLTVAPELAVEVVGKGQGWGKMTQKAGEYFDIGVDRVWIVDPKAQTVHIFRPDMEPARLTKADTLRDPKLLPGFSCKVAAFFED